MPQQIDYFDPEEIRRRRLLAPTSEMGGPEEENPLIGDVMAPDEQEVQEEQDQPPSAAAAQARQHPALDRFKQVIGQQPNIDDYKPSKWTRMAAALSGFSAGMRDPAKGVEVASNITHAPYQRALTAWQNSLKGSQLGVGAEEKEEGYDVARQRAKSYDLSAQARMKAANATETWRQTQADNEGRRIKIDEENAKRPRNYWETPETTERYTGAQQAIHPPRDYKSEEDMKAKHARELEALRGQHAMDRTKYRVDNPVPKQYAPPTPKAQTDAEQGAIDELLRQDPSVENFVHKAAVDKNGKVVRPHRIKTADEITAGGFMGIGGPSDTEKSLKRDQYNQFLMKVNKKKLEILGRNQAATPEWQIQPQED